MSQCQCGDLKLIFACSGSADVGEVADRTARLLMARKAGSMYCLAGLGGRISGFVESTKAAETVLVIDGCPLHCGRKTLETSGVEKFEHLCLTDLGMKKGSTATSEVNVSKVAQAGLEKLGGEKACVPR